MNNLYKNNSLYDLANEVTNGLSTFSIEDLPVALGKIVDAAENYIMWYEGEEGVHQAGYYTSYEEGAVAWITICKE